MTTAAIVMVDDEKTILDGLKGQLRAMFGPRYSYETAEDAGEALEVLAELQAGGVTVVLVVSDWLMPGKRGDELLAEIRTHYPHVVRILLTGQADAAAIRRAWELARVHEVIRKPWSADHLRQVIEAALPQGGPRC